MLEITLLGTGTGAPRTHLHSDHITDLNDVITTNSATISTASP
ncbi:MAG: hypothetical protein ACR2O6_15605 [Ilumatobacteraceae bacterium]